VSASAAGARAQPARSADSPDAAFARLMEGNARYVSGQLTERDFSAGRVARTQGQKPFAAILGCADSRVAPELAFDQGPGELFVVRVAGNFVTPDGLGSLEYGAAVLGTKVIMVLGHTSCGAIGATIGALQNGNTLPGHIAGLVTANARQALADTRRRQAGFALAAPRGTPMRPLTRPHCLQLVDGADALPIEVKRIVLGLPAVVKHARTKYRRA